MKTTFVHKKLQGVAAIASAFALVSMHFFNSVAYADNTNDFTVIFKPTMIGDNLAVDLINLNDATSTFNEPIANFYASLVSAKFLPNSNKNSVYLDPQNKFRIIFKKSASIQQSTQTALINCMDSWFVEMDGIERLYLKEALQGTEQRPGDSAHFSQEFLEYVTKSSEKCESIPMAHLNDGIQWFLPQYLVKKVANETLPARLVPYDKVLSKSVEFFYQEKSNDNQTVLMGEVKPWFSRIKNLGFPVDASIQFTNLFKRFDNKNPPQKSWIVAETLRQSASVDEVRNALESKDFSLIEKSLFLADQVLEGCTNNQGRLDTSRCSGDAVNERFFWLEISGDQGSFKIPLVK